MLALALPLTFMPLLILYAPLYVRWSSSAIIFFLLTLFSLTSLSSPIITLKVMGVFNDLLSVQLITITLWITGLIIITRQKVIFDQSRPLLFTFTVICLAIILILAFSTSSLIRFYIFFEASLIPTFILIMGWGYQPERLQASIYLILYTVAASLPLLLSLIKIFKISGHLNLSLDI